MHRGYRSIVAALAGLALSGAQPPVKEAQRTEGAARVASAPKVAAAPVPAPTSEPTTKFTAYPGYDPDPCYQTEDHEVADLCAQWRAATAAERAAHEARRATNWAIIATFLSAGGLALLIWSLRQTEGALREARRGNRITLTAERRARRDAKIASEVNEQALAHGRDAASAELRAWLSLTPKLRHFLFSDTQLKIDFTVSVTNTGKSIARDVRATAVCYNEANPNIVTRCNQLFEQMRKDMGPFSGDTIIPNDSSEYNQNATADPKKMIWGPGDTVSAIIAMRVTYLVDFDATPRVIEQAFFVGPKDSDFLKEQRLRRDMTGVALEEVTIKKLRPGVVT